jgi:hypothetical protein
MRTGTETEARSLSPDLLDMAAADFRNAMHWLVADIFTWLMLTPHWEISSKS